MTTIRKVRLEGGPFDGQTLELDATRQLLTLDWEDESLERDWDGTVVYVTRTGLATYRRIEPDRFEYCPTPTALGDAQRILKGDR